MSHKELSRGSNKSSVVALDEKDQLDQLPEKYRDEILKQYDLPDVKVNLFTILGYGTSLDMALQIVGSIMAVGAGLPPLRLWHIDIAGAALPLMTILVGNLTNVFGSLVAPGAHGIQSLSSQEEFHAQVSHQALVLVYLGLSVFCATYIGTMSWIITGERISRRIRMYVPRPQYLT